MTKAEHIVNIKTAQAELRAYNAEIGNTGTEWNCDNWTAAQDAEVRRLTLAVNTAQRAARRDGIRPVEWLR